MFTSYLIFQKLDYLEYKFYNETTKRHGYTCKGEYIIYNF